MIQAVLAIEDRRFYDHPGIDPIGIAGAVFDNVFGSKAYLRGGSTVTQQLVKNTFLTPEQDAEAEVDRMVHVGGARDGASRKDQILQLYLNDVSLGQRGSFAIHGVAEAARLFFAKDVTQPLAGEAATIAGVIQSPSRLSPFNNPERAKERRNVVLHAMADAGFISGDDAPSAPRASRCRSCARALEAEAPYFVDYVTQELQDEYIRPPAPSTSTPRSTSTCSGSRRTRVRDGLTASTRCWRGASGSRAGGADCHRPADRRDPRARRRPLLQPVAVQPRVSARRQPGSVFKPFVYLAAFEHAQARGTHRPHAGNHVSTSRRRSSSTQQTWTPRNYDGEYDGPITLRRALALSRNIATIKVAESAGYDEVAALWRRVGAGTPPRPYPSIALGVFEATPFEIATAYTLFPNGGTIRPLRAISRLVAEGKDLPLQNPEPRTVARPDTTFLVTNMMRSVINEGTGAGARAAGFALDAAGKSGTTNDLRDAWFVGFTPELLTVVWVGLDDNQPRRPERHAGGPADLDRRS